jgi:hypothetical protein
MNYYYNRTPHTVASPEDVRGLIGVAIMAALFLLAIIF